MAVNGIALAAVATGGIFVYAGIRGFSVSQTLQNILTGKTPVLQSQANPIGTPASTITGPTPPGSNSAVAQDALQYEGKMRYVWGGAPKDGGVDCSSFVNMVVGRDLGRAIPGYHPGQYDGSTHGPPTVIWLVWPGATTVGHKGSDALAGDICVWQTHMGIAIGGGKMISARSQDSNPNIGIDTIDGDIPGEALFVRRLGNISNLPGQAVTPHKGL